MCSLHREGIEPYNLDQNKIVFYATLKLMEMVHVLVKHRRLSMDEDCNGRLERVTAPLERGFL